MFATLQMDNFFNVKLYAFKSLGEPTYHSENEWIYFRKFAWYVERSLKS